MFKFVLAMVACIGMLCVSTFGEENFNDEMNLLTAIGTISEENIQNIDLDAKVTRAEFCRYVYDLHKYNTYLGDKNELPFRDVDSSHKNFNSICVLYQMNVINGKTQYTFEPNSTINGGEALKILMTTLGYQPDAVLKGGFPNGFLSAAVDADIDVSFSVIDELTHRQVIKLLYDALFVIDKSITEYTQWGPEYKGNDELLLETAYGIKEYKGIIEETKYTSFKGSGGLRDNQVKIDGEIFETELDLNDYLGFFVTFYLKTDSNGDEKIVYAYADDKYNDVLTVEADNIDDKTSKDSFVYIDENNKTKTVEISKVVNVICNGFGKPDFTKEDLIPKTGTVTLIDSDNDNKQDVIIVADYETIVVKEIFNTENALTITNKNGEDFLVEKESGVDVLVYKNEALTDFSDIKNGNVLFIKDSGADNGKRLVEIFISTKTVNGKMISLVDDTVTIADAEYKINNSMEVSGIQRFVGTNVTGYLDISGKIAYVETGTGGEAYGYLYSIFRTDEDDIRANILTDDNEYRTMKLADKVSCNNQRIDTEKVYELFTNNGKTKMQLIRFKQNSDGEIVALNYAVAVSDDEHEETLREEGIFRISAPRKKRFFENRSKLFMSGPGAVYWTDLFIDSSLKVVLRPSTDNPSKEEIYFLDYSYFKADMPSYDIEGYDLSDTNMLGAVVVYGEKSAESVEKDQEFVVVDKIADVLYEDGEVYKTLVVFERGEQKQYPVKDAKILQYNGVELKRGDITRIVVDNKGFVIALENTPLKFSITENYTKYYTDAESCGSDATAAYPYYQVVVGEVKEVSGDMLKLRVKDSSDGKPVYLKAKLRTDTKYVKCDNFRENEYVLSKGVRSDLIPGSVVVLRIHWTTLFDVVIYNF